MLEWQTECDYQLCDGLYLDQNQKVVVLDLETTGLDHRVHSIVGLAYSQEEKTGGYIPISHKESDVKNVPLLAIIRQLNEYDAKYKPLWVMYNAKFDVRWLRAAG